MKITRLNQLSKGTIVKYRMTLRGEQRVGIVLSVKPPNMDYYREPQNMVVTLLTVDGKQKQTFFTFIDETIN